MYARVTRFTDCDPEAIDRTIAGVEEAEGPPEGVPSSGLQVLVDESAGTVVFIGLFETEEDLRTGDAALRALDPPGGVPGTRASVDMGEIKVERSID